MLSKTRIKYLNSLKNKKNRIEENCFVAEGDKIVRDVLDAGWEVRELIANPNWLAKQDRNIIEKAHRITEAGFEEIKKVSSLKTPNNAMAVVKMPDTDSEPGILKDELAIALDRIQDPGNLGTIIRTAAWFGIKRIYCSPESVDVFNPKVIQSTMSGILRVEVRYTSLEELADEYINNSLPVYGTFLEGEDIYGMEKGGAGLLIMGNESKGIGPSLEEKVNRKIYIPSFADAGKAIDSLNIATATAIVCSEFIGK